jgi:predicted Zn-dependent protease
MTRPLRLRVGGLVGAALFAFLPGCARNVPASDLESSGSPKKKRTVLVTEYDDLAVGEDAAREIEAEMGVYESPELAAYVTEIGLRLVQHAPRRPFQYNFHVLNQMTPNAFSLPGGHVYVTRGLLALANSEDELANVLGHEIIHAAERHVAAQQELARRTNPFTLPLMRLAQLAAYSRDHERAADKGGQILAAKAGYDPAGLSEFLKHLGDAERLTIGYSRIVSYFDTHPGTTERVSSTAAQAVTLEWKRDESRPAGGPSYLRRLEGTILDTDPAEGIFRDNEFVHPDIEFRILLPRGWELVNTHEAVGAVSPDGQARFFITLEAPLGRGSADAAAGSEGATAPLEASDEPPPEMPTPEQAADRFLEENGEKYGVRLQRRQPVQLAEVEAYRLEMDALMGTTPVSGHVTFIPHRQSVLRLTTVAVSGAWSQYQGRAHATLRTFRSLSAEERASVEVLRLGLAHALEGENIAELSQRTANVWPPGRTAVLNGVFVDARFHEGELVKIARASPYVATAARRARPRTPGDEDAVLGEPSVP